MSVLRRYVALAGNVSTVGSVAALAGKANATIATTPAMGRTIAADTFCLLFRSICCSRKN
jgi:hypothetical protein